jgi:hypothetical protein
MMDKAKKYDGEVSIIARTAGFRRCGMAHSLDEVTHVGGTFTVDEVAILQADPQLIVTLEQESETAAERKARLKAEAGK